MRVDILTLFPDTVNAFLHESILGRAAAKGLIEINCVQIRDYTENKQKQVDDYPYGGGRGCVLMAQPLQSCLEAVVKEVGERKRRVIYLSPQGKPFRQEDAKRLRDAYDHLVLVCGHYEGIDERFIEKSVDEEISLGDFVLTGGEIAAMAVADAVCRLVPGVLADEQCFTDESHWDGLLEYPQYTRPDVWEGLEVPEVLRDGNHAGIAAWRRKQQLLRTRQKRPDLFEKLDLSAKEDKKLLAEIETEAARVPLTKKILCRAAQEEEAEEILRVFPQAKHLRERLHNGSCYLLLHGDDIAAFFELSTGDHPEYASLRDGKWTGNVPGCVLAGAAVADAYQNSDMPKQMMMAAERQAEELGFHCIRTDISRKDKLLRQLLRDFGYRYRGNITYEKEIPLGCDPARQAYEKIWKVKTDNATDKQQ